MNILVVGGTRFFGIQTVNALLNGGHQVAVATRGNSFPSFCGTVERIVFDKTNAQSVKAALNGRRFDAIIDKIAYSSNDVKALLQNARCGKYIQMSSCAVYQKIHTDTKEDEFDAAAYPLRWTDRSDDYAESKRLAERAALEFLPAESCAFVRYPIVLGPNDYTKRLVFYIDRIKKGEPIFVDDLDMQSPFIHEDEAGDFIAHLAEHFVSGGVNGASNGTIKIKDLVSRVESAVGKKALLDKAGEPAPFNGLPCDRSINTQKARSLGFKFMDLNGWLDGLIELEAKRA